MTNKEVNTLIQGDIPVLFDFYADWCGPCQAQTPIINEIEKHYGEQLHILRINVDKERKLSEKYSIFSIPSLILMHKGEQKWKVAGVRSMRDIQKIVDKELGIKETPTSKDNFFSNLFKKKENK
ncbi:MAG: thioredoxin family protein [Brumimicrobium sp.]|nr:thioredoxin family protein [Brumimicrobium sp.]